MPSLPAAQLHVRQKPISAPRTSRRVYHYIPIHAPRRKIGAHVLEVRCSFALDVPTTPFDANQLNMRCDHTSSDASNAIDSIMFPLDMPWVDCNHMHFGGPVTFSPASSQSTLGFFTDATLQPTAASPEAAAETTSALRACDCQSLVSAHLQSAPLVAIAFDSTIMANEDTLSLVQQLIRCPCLHPPSFLMMPYLLLHTVLQLSFEAWWSWCRTVTEKSDTGARGERVFVGSLRLSDEDSRLLRGRIVLQLLEKVKELQVGLDEKTRDGRLFDVLHSFVSRSLAVEVERTLVKVSQRTPGPL